MSPLHSPRPTQSWRAHALLAFLFLAYATGPLVDSPRLRGLVMLLVLGMAALSAARRPLLAWIGLGLAGLLGSLILRPEHWVQAGALGAIALFLIYVVVMLLLDVRSQADVNLATISLALAVYMLLALTWNMLFGLLEELAPGSFAGLPAVAGVEGAREANLEALSYFSVVTLTTVGYGDILPIGAWARRLATLEALIGQIFLVVLVARLVSVHAARQPSAATQPEPRRDRDPRP